MIDFNKYFIVGTNSYALHDTMNGLVVGELIHCKNCKYWDKSRINYNEHVCYWGGYVKREDDFCSWAERRNDERME